MASELEWAFSDLTEAIRYARAPFQYNPPAQRQPEALTPELITAMRERFSMDRLGVGNSEAEMVPLVYAMARGILKEGQKIAFEAFKQIEAAEAGVWAAHEKTKKGKSK